MNQKQQETPPSYTNYNTEYNQPLSAPNPVNQPPVYNYPSAPQAPNQANYNYASGVVVTQPPYVQGFAVNTVPDNMSLAVFATILCCWPVGLFAIMKASEARSLMLRGDMTTALQRANESRRLSMISIICGIISAIIIIVIVVVVVVVNNNAVTAYYAG